MPAGFQTLAAASLPIMRCSDALVIASFVLIFASRASGLEPIPLQKATTHIDDHGCIHFEATARMEVSPDDLFESLTRPERFLRSGYSYPRLVFLPSAITRESLSENKWTIGWPSEKILEFDSIGSGSVSKDTVIPKRWVEYDFYRLQHTVHQYDIGSTYPWGFSNPHSDSTYVLSPLDNGSATSLHYTNVKCYPPEVWNRLTPDKNQGWWLSAELESVQLEAEAIAEQRTKASPSPSATPTCTPAPQTIPTATATPTVKSFGAAD